MTQDFIPTRRKALGQLLGAGGAGVASAVVGSAALSTPAVAADCGAYPRAKYDDYLARFNANDPSFIDFYHDDVVLELGNATIKTPAGIRDFYKEVKAHIKETVSVTHYVADATGIAVELPSEFAVFKDWSGGYFPRDLKVGEVMRVISFGMYWVEDGKFTYIKAARYRQVNDWQQEGFTLDGAK